MERFKLSAVDREMLGGELPDPRIDFRKLMKKHSIEVPDELLTLAEQIFVPKSIQNSESSE